MASKIELYDQQEAIGLTGFLGRGQRVIKITGECCEYFDDMIKRQSFSLGSITLRGQGGIQAVCLIVPEYGAQQSECNEFNKIFMEIKLAMRDNVDEWLVPKDFNAVPKSYY